MTPDHQYGIDFKMDAKNPGDGPASRALQNASKQVADKVSNVLKAAMKASGAPDTGKPLDEELVIPTGIKGSNAQEKLTKTLLGRGESPQDYLDRISTQKKNPGSPMQNQQIVDYYSRAAANKS